MSVIFILVIFSIIVAGGFLGAFIWAVRSGQYDDTYSPSVRMLFEEEQSGSSKPVNSSTAAKPPVRVK
jgi:cbb3-type cytochrome oxidase maturation protein